MAFTSGAIVGVLLPALGVLLARGLLSPAPEDIRTAAFVVIGVTVGVIQLGTGRCVFPNRHWQIPSSWILSRSNTGVAQFGLVLGAGVFTYVPSCSAYVLLIGLCLLHSPLAVLGAATLGFAVGRSAELLVRSFAPWLASRLGATLDVDSSSTSRLRATAMIVLTTSSLVAVQAAGS